MCSLNFHEFSNRNEFSSKMYGVIHLLLEFILYGWVFQKTSFQKIISEDIVYKTRAYYLVIFKAIPFSHGCSMEFIFVYFYALSMSCFVYFKEKKAWNISFIPHNTYTLVRITASTTHKAYMSYLLIYLYDTQFKNSTLVLWALLL